MFLRPSTAPHHGWHRRWPYWLPGSGANAPAHHDFPDPAKARAACGNRRKPGSWAGSRMTALPAPRRRWPASYRNRWFRGFNDYDNWQASGVSGQGARSFYYPPKTQVCADCHMPLVPSHDPGNHNGEVHSHSFPGANLAVPTANHDEKQLAEEKKFMTSGFITVDIFAVSPVDENSKQTTMVRRAQEGPQLMTGMAV